MSRETVIGWILAAIPMAIIVWLIAPWAPEPTRTPQEEAQHNRLAAFTGVMILPASVGIILAFLMWLYFYLFPTPPCSYEVGAKHPCAGWENQ